MKRSHDEAFNNEPLLSLLKEPINIDTGLIHGHIYAHGNKTNYFKSSNFYSVSDTNCDLEIFVNNFIGKESRHDYTTLFIVESHKHLNFFKTICSILSTIEESYPITWYINLNIVRINEILTILHTKYLEEKDKEMKIKEEDTIICEKLLNILSEQELKQLPKHFQTASIPLENQCITFIDKNVIRCYNGLNSDTIMRWNYLFKTCCKSNYNEDDINHEYTTFPNCVYVRNYEKQQLNPTKDIWPYVHNINNVHNLTKIEQQFETYGIVNIALPEILRLNKYILITAKYLMDILKWNDNNSDHNSKYLIDLKFMKSLNSKPKEYIYRNVKNLRSRHIPQRNGRTRYGHYCPELKILFKNLSYIINTVYKSWLHTKNKNDEEIIVTTSEIIIQI